MASSSSWGSESASNNMMEDDNDNDDVMMGSAAGAAGGGGGATAPSSSTSVEDQLGLLQQQLSCLRTNDKDVLVSQFQKIVGPSLNTYAAHFFLDMNNWNVQLAVGSYFDLIGGGGGGGGGASTTTTTSVFNNDNSTSSSLSYSTIPHIVVDPPCSLNSNQRLSWNGDAFVLGGAATSLYAANVISLRSSDSTATSTLTCEEGGESCYLCVVHSAPGRKATVQVVLENWGHTPWPIGTRLYFVAGNANIVCDHESSLATTQLVQPRERSEMLLTLLVPLSAGVPSEIVMEFRIVTPDLVHVNSPGGAPAAPAIKIRVEVEDDDALSRRMMLLST